MPTGPLVTTFGPWEGAPGSATWRDGTYNRQGGLLRPGDIALSPDLAANYHFGDHVTIRLADGQVISGRYVDVTRGDLTNRVDVWSPRNPGPNSALSGNQHATILDTSGGNQLANNSTALPRATPSPQLPPLNIGNPSSYDFSKLFVSNGPVYQAPSFTPPPAMNDPRVSFSVGGEPPRGFTAESSSSPTGYTQWNGTEWVPADRPSPQPTNIPPPATAYSWTQDNQGNWQPPSINPGSAPAPLSANQIINSNMPTGFANNDWAGLVDRPDPSSPGSLLGRIAAATPAGRLFSGIKNLVTGNFDAIPAVRIAKTIGHTLEGTLGQHGQPTNQSGLSYDQQLDQAYMNLPWLQFGKDGTISGGTPGGTGTPYGIDPKTGEVVWNATPAGNAPVQGAPGTPQIPAIYANAGISPTMYLQQKDMQASDAAIMAEAAKPGAPNRWMPDYRGPSPDEFDSEGNVIGFGNKAPAGYVSPERLAQADSHWLRQFFPSDAAVAAFKAPGGVTPGTPGVPGVPPVSPLSFLPTLVAAPPPTVTLPALRIG